MIANMGFLHWTWGSDMAVITLGVAKGLRVTPLMRLQEKQGEGMDGFIAGIVTEKELPVIRRVMCYHRKSGKLLKTTWSDINGHYRFDGLVANLAYFITSVDENIDAVQYNAVTQDLVTASEVIL